MLNPYRSVQFQICYIIATLEWYKVAETTDKVSVTADRCRGKSVWECHQNMASARTSTWLWPCKNHWPISLVLLLGQFPSILPSSHYYNRWISIPSPRYCIQSMHMFSEPSRPTYHSPRDVFIVNCFSRNAVKTRGRRILEKDLSVAAPQLKL